MSDEPGGPRKAYRNERFLASSDARGIRILSEFMEPQARFRDLNVADVIVFFGSARVKPRDEAERALAEAKAAGGDVSKAEHALKMSAYYEDARTLAHRLTQWSKSLEDPSRRFLVCTGGGPGIMEAANRGASEAGGINIGLVISLPHEQENNRFVTRELSLEFHYFFMRKFWFAYLAKAIVFFPGGFGTLDELFEVLTLVQTRKIRKHLPIVLFDKAFWSATVNFDALVANHTIAEKDLDLFLITDSVDEAFDHITEQLIRFGLEEHGARL